VFSLICFGFVSVYPATASARGLKTGFADQSLFASPDGSVRSAWLDQAVKEHADVIRINVFWSEVVGSQPPANPTNPADSAYDFSSIDAAVTDARARGFTVMLTVLRAPVWALGRNPPDDARPGAWKPDPKALGEFAQALARRYSGKLRGGLPRVRYFEAWNEPNQTGYLAPQWEGKRRVSPDRYRRLLNAFYAGVKAAQPTAVVIGGAMSPFGDSRGDPLDPRRPRIRPLVFARDLFCLSRKLKRTRCGAKPHLDVLSQHPINQFNPPDYSAINPNDIQVADFHKLRRVLRAAERVKHVRPAGHHALWATEIWWQTKPPTDFGVPVARQARWLEESMYMLWKQGASAVVQFNIRDPANAGSFLSPASGVFFHSGEKKPAYRSFRFPFVTHRKSKKRVGLWGKAPETGKLKVQKKRRKGWHTIDKLNVRAGKIFTESLRLRGKAKLRGKIGKTTSLVWRQR
jgi:Cellulase (glycosyl hydrolase family 5)